MGEKTNEQVSRAARVNAEDRGRLPPEVARCLDEYRSRARRFALVKGVAITVTVYVALVITIALLDRLVRMPVWLRCMLSFGSMSGLIAFAYYAFVAPVFRRPDTRETALDLERSDPDFNEALLTTVDHLAASGMPKGFSEALLCEVARGTAGVAGGLEVSRVLPARLVRRIAIVAGVALAVFGALFAVPGLGFARLVVRFHAPLANMPRASLIGLSVEPGSTVVGTGDPLEISARLSKPFEGRVVLHVRHKGESWSKSEMTECAEPAAPAEEVEEAEGTGQPTPEALVREIETVTSTFDYYVTAGGAESARYRIVAVDRPLPELFLVRYEPPAYTGAAAVTSERPTGAVRGLKGSRVTLGVRPSVPLTRAELMKDGFSIPMEIAGEGMLASCEFNLEKDGSYSLRLEGEYGLANRDEREYPIRALQDAPPAVNARLVRAASRIDPEGALCISYEARDDWGVRSAGSFVSLNGAEPTGSDLPLARPGRRVANDFLVDLKSLGAKKGDHVRIVVAARDSLDQVGRSREIAIWLGRDAAARAAAERARRIKAAAEAVRDMQKLREALAKDRARLADLMRKDGWSAERERKLAEVRRLERQLQTTAERAREELRAARELADDDLARALSVASRKLLRERLESSSLDETLARLDTADEASRDRAARALERVTERAPKDEKLAEALEKISTGEQSTAALEQDGALAERRERLDEIGKEEMTPAREEFVEREEELMKREKQELAEDVNELGLNLDRPRWKDEGRELAEAGRRAAEELIGQDDVAQEMAALAEEAKDLAQAEPEDAEAGLEAIRGEMEDLQEVLAEAARDETALDRPDYLLARDEDLTRAALEGMERRNLEEAAPQVGARQAAERIAEELGEAAEAREALEEAGELRREQEDRARPDAEVLEAAEREAEKARDTLARLAGDPAEALERLAAREEQVAGEAAEAGQQAEQQAEQQQAEQQADAPADAQQVEQREELADLAETQAHLVNEAARLAERLMHEANAETAAAQPDTEHIAALDELRQGIEELVQDEMNEAAEALEEAALGRAAAAEEAAQLGNEAAEELARLANEARQMAREQAARDVAQGQPEQAPADPALAELGQLAGLEAEQRDLAEQTRTSDAADQPQGQELAREQQALGERTRETTEAMDAQRQALEAARDAAANAAERAEELAGEADALAQELGETGEAAPAAAQAGEIAEGAQELAQDVGEAAQAAQAAIPQAAPQMQAAAQSTAQGAEAAQAGHQATQADQAQPAAGQFAQAAENLAQAAEDLARLAAAAEAAQAPGAEAAMQTATAEQNAAQQALASGQQNARQQAHGNQLAAADALGQARQEMARAINSARAGQAMAMQSAQAQAQSAEARAQAGAMAQSGTPGGSDRQGDGRVAGEAPRADGGDWGRLREAEDDSKFAEREGITVQYADPIRLYFEAVAREGRRE